MIDLHRHLEGSIRPETVLDVIQNYKLPLPKKLDALLDRIRVIEPDPDLMTFIGKLDRAVSILLTYDICTRITYEAIEDAKNDGIVYLELRFSPLYMARQHNLQPEGVTSAVIEGARQAEKDFGIKTNLIGILSRTFGVEAVTRELDALLSYKEQITALDIAGDEARFPAELFIDQFEKGRSVGWHITAHAGEALGPESVWTAIKELKAERIGHGTRSIEDARLMEFLKEQKIGIESAVTSNLHTTTVKDYAQHPLKAFLEYGILATINTDDPSVSGITLSHELHVAALKAGLNSPLIQQAQQNSIEVAFLSKKDKEVLRDKIAELLKANIANDNKVNSLASTTSL